MVEMCLHAYKVNLFSSQATHCSLVRNQFNSLACLLWEADPDIKRKHVVSNNEHSVLSIASQLYDLEIHFIFTGNILDIKEEDLFQPSQSIIYKTQKMVGEVLADELASIIAQAERKFKFFEFVLLVPNRNSLFKQTVDRLNEAGLTPRAVVFKVDRE